MSAADLVYAVIRSARFPVQGRLTRDPEIKYFQSGSSVVKLRLAVNKPGAKRDDGSEPDWFTVELWNDDAMTAVNAFRKGDMIEATGRITTETWTDNNGKAHTDLVLKQVSNCHQVNKPGTAPGQAPAAPAAAPAAAAPGWGGGAGGWGAGDPSDEEVPF